VRSTAERKFPERPDHSESGSADSAGAVAELGTDEEFDAYFNWNVSYSRCVIRVRNCIVAYAMRDSWGAHAERKQEHAPIRTFLLCQGVLSLRTVPIHVERGHSDCRES
jgi:hypothetical protein